MNGEHENRVLGRILAVEETMNVSGAKPTLPRHDNITDPCYDSVPNGTECARTPTTSGAMSGANISAILNHTSST